MILLQLHNDNLGQSKGLLHQSRIQKIPHVLVVMVSKWHCPRWLFIPGSWGEFQWTQIRGTICSPRNK